MKRKVGFLLGLLGLVALVAVVVRVLGNRGPKLGELRIDSAPVASVFLDNKHLGRTPYKDKVAAGEYTLKLVPESTTTNLAGWEGKIVVGQNLLTYINANLSESELSSAVDVVWLEKITSNQSELSVTTTPDGATVLVDDVTKGVTPLSLQDISIGEHRVSVTSAGFVPRTHKIKTTAGYRLIAALKLALTPGGSLPEASPTAEPKEDGTPTPTPRGTKTATSSATVADPPKPFVVIKDTPTGFLRVREEPNTSATESARVNPGEKYTYFDSENGWYQIKYDGKNTGWVSGQYVEKVE